MKADGRNMKMIIASHILYTDRIKGELFSAVHKPVMLR